MKLEIIEPGDPRYMNAPVGSVIRTSGELAIVVRGAGCRGCMYKGSSLGIWGSCIDGRPHCTEFFRGKGNMVLFRRIRIHRTADGVYRPQLGDILWHNGKRIKVMPEDETCVCEGCHYYRKGGSPSIVSCNGLIYIDITEAAE